MIPEIGVMIAAYIVIRMMVVLGTQWDPHAGTASWQLLTKIGAGLTILVSCVVALDLLARGTSSVPALSGALR